ncbi:hypothetical protein B0H11DRAFT_2088025 [Mycena galericulata]|nr:hypothetical protein B0H11DRAFT_2088025 [Mycena galericulata]
MSTTQYSNNTGGGNGNQSQDECEGLRISRRNPPVCQMCRARKLTCDGKFPQCSNCIRCGCPCAFIPLLPESEGRLRKAGGRAA